MILSTLIDNLSQWGDVLSRLWPIFLMAGAVASGLKFTWKQIVARLSLIVKEAIDPVMKEVTPNGGGSMKDAVKRVEVMGEDIVTKMEGLATGLDQAIKIATANQSRVSAVLANFEAAYYEMDAEGSILYVNDAFLRLYDITEREALNGEAWRSFISKEDLEMMDRTGKHAMDAHVDWYATFTVRRNGAEIPVVARAKPMFAGDEFIGFSGAMTFNPDDIPEKQRCNAPLDAILLGTREGASIFLPGCL